MHIWLFVVIYVKFQVCNYTSPRSELHGGLDPCEDPIIYQL